MSTHTNKGREIPEWIKKMRHANKGMKGVRVYYLMSGVDVICSDIAVRTRANVVEFPDGGWNHTKDCFLTAGQCRRATGLAVREIMAKARQQLQKAGRLFETTGEALALLEEAISHD